MRLPFVIVSSAFCLAIGYGQSDRDDSPEKYQKEIAANPSGSLAHFRLGEIYFKQRDYQSASNEFRAALNGDHDPPSIERDAHIMLATIYNLSGQYARAQNEYRFALSLTMQPARVPPPGTYLSGHGVTDPLPIQKTEPEYTNEARLAGLEGVVELTGTITEQGQPKDMHVTGSLGFGLDERALAAVQQWVFQPGMLDGQPLPVYTTVSMEFHLPEKHSRWHLIRADFQPPEDVIRPQFSKTSYPYGSGISAAAAEEGWVLTAIGRQATATISFSVNEHGNPTDLQVLNSSAPIWGNEAIAVVRNWQFVPGSKFGAPTSVPGTVDLVWGARNLTSKSFQWAVTQLSSSLFVATSAPATTDGGVSPRVIYATEPEYTEDARKAGLQGTVVVNLFVAQDGTPENLRVDTPLGFGLDEKAIEAVRQWRFSPRLMNGVPVRARTAVEVRFRLPRDASQRNPPVRKILAH